MAVTLTTPTVTFDLPDTGVLDDLTVDADALTDAWAHATALAAGRAARANTVHPVDSVTVHDRWVGEDATVHAFLTLHPAF